MGQLAGRGSLQGQPSGAQGELAGKYAPSEGSQHLPCAEPRQAGWANGAMKRGGRRPSSRLGSALGFGAVSGGAVSAPSREARS
jgi:hypothetical protein